MGQVIRTSISLSAWPELDQRLWYSATTKGEFLAPDGKAAHWVPETKRQVEKGYGKLGLLFDAGVGAALGRKQKPV